VGTDDGVGSDVSEESSINHRLGSAETLFGRLEDDHEATNQLVAIKA
jgi:hypothetical protein